MGEKVEEAVKKAATKGLAELQQKQEAVAQKIVDQLETAKKRNRGLNI